MVIVADKNIPFLNGVLEPYAEVVYAPGDAIASPLVRDADALLVRTRTLCNAALLAGSRVKFIGTATIGTDHIALDYCQRQGITVASAAGCNAAAVRQYVARTLVAIEEKTGKDVRRCTMGIVGVGNVGKRVERLAQALGMRTLLNDPPRAAREGAAGFVPLGKLLEQSDIVTLHVPLDDTTRGMANAVFFDRMKADAAFINTSRGEVVDEDALLNARSKLSFIALDVWRNEPNINLDLLRVADIATPHIAGYSLQGKCNATTMAVQALAQFFGIDALTNFTVKPDKTATVIDFSDAKHNVYSRISENYAIFEDDKLLRNEPQSFEKIRNNYTYRNELCLPSTTSAN